MLNAKRLLPGALREWLQARRRNFLTWPPIRRVRFGAMQKVTPVSRVFGLDRGQTICRYYVEDFLSQYATDIRGCVLEIADNSYTRRFGGERVSRSEVLHVQEGNPRATIVA